MTHVEGPYRERTDTIVEPPPMVEVPVEGQYVAPVAAQVATPVAPQVVAAPVAAPVVAAPASQVRVAYTSRWEPDAIIAAIGGLVLLVVGLIAITRGGFDGPMADPVVTVLGFTHTTTLGLIEIAFGLFLLIAGVSRSRAGATFFGTALGIAGFVGAVQTESFDESLALESSMAWLVVLLGAVIALSALMMPRFARHTTTVERL